jgi:HPt (histidine-containing phosphotransfer) domain-containing protein
MYCILSQSNDIVASDLEFLNLFGTTSLVELYKKITSEDVKISLDYDKITLTINNNAKMYDIKATPMTTLFGKSVLVELMSINIKSEFIKAPDFNAQTSGNIKKTVTKVEVVTTKQPDNTQPIKNEPLIESGFDLENLKDIAIYENEPKIEEKTNQELFINPKVTIDIPNIAKNMHLSEKEYSVFLNEYTSSVDKFKKDLQGNDKKAKENAISFIKHITTALCLPKDIENFVNSLNANGSKELFDNLFDVINNIKELNTPLSNPSKQEEAQIENILNSDISVDKLDSIDIIEEIKPDNEIKVKQKNIIEETLPSIDINEPLGIDLMDNTISDDKPKQSTDSAQITKIDLSKIKPLPFDFILEESAKELSLPNDIVKEFIKDFIEQCHADTNKIIQKYEEGNIEKVKKLAHSLKGVASNLYVMPLANSLLDLQNNDDLSKVKSLIEKYWGQFLYLENIMKNI